MIRLVLTGMIILFCFRFAAAQTDTTQQPTRWLPEVQIGGWYSKIETSPAAVQTLTVHQIEHLPALQLSDALKYMSGVVVKDYGGTGGMKTVSVRGLGSQHTGVAYDGMALTDCQTGQIDLGKLTLDNVGTLTLTTGMDQDIFKPARLFSYSNLLNINTSNIFPNKPFKMKLALTMGMYGFVSPQLFLENLIKSKTRENRFVIWNLSANFTHSNGQYPYILHYGGITDSVSRERRQNSDINALNLEANVKYSINADQQFLVKWYYYDSERGLPSATVFYNLNSSQRLWNQNTFAQAQYYHHFGKGWRYQIGGKFNYDYTRYLDPEYLNAEGKLDNHYHQYEGYLTNVVNYTLPKNDRQADFSVSLANDLFYNQLNSSTVEYSNPARFTTMTSLSVRGGKKMFTIVGNLLFTTVNNMSQGEQLGKNYLHLSPAVSASLNLKDRVTLRAFYKNIFRMPTFNDLYYREVGNLNLEPEKTHQWNLGAVLEQQRMAAGKVYLSASLDGYFNIVKDKIVAFPSHNLFSWTMLNYGTVWIAGAEANTNLEYQFVKKYYLRFNGNCTYQKAVDRTDPTGKTFNHQIPYTPVWSGSTSLGFETPWITITYAVILCGKRYALGENIPANEVSGYVDHSITLSHEFDIQQTKLGLKLELLNLANQNYLIIRNYPMQGFGLRGRISWGF